MKFVKLCIILCRKRCLIRFPPYKLENRLVYGDNLQNMCFTYVLSIIILYLKALFYLLLWHYTNKLHIRWIAWNLIVTVKESIRKLWCFVYKVMQYLQATEKNQCVHPVNITNVLICLIFNFWFNVEITN